jgi:hypothetical protein
LSPIPNSTFSLPPLSSLFSFFSSLSFFCRLGSSHPCKPDRKVDEKEISLAVQEEDKIEDTGVPPASAELGWQRVD